MTKDFRADDEKNAPDSKGAKEDQIQKISAVRSGEAMGRESGPREEHSGQNKPTRDAGMADIGPKRKK